MWPSIEFKIFSLTSSQIPQKRVTVCIGLHYNYKWKNTFALWKIKGQIPPWNPEKKKFLSRPYLDHQHSEGIGFRFGITGPECSARCFLQTTICHNHTFISISYLPFRLMLLIKVYYCKSWWLLLSFRNNVNNTYIHHLFLILFSYLRHICQSLSW